MDKPGIDLYTVHLDEKRTAHINGRTPEKTPKDAVDKPGTDLYIVHLGEHIDAQNGAGYKRQGKSGRVWGSNPHGYFTSAIAALSRTTRPSGILPINRAKVK